MVSQAARHHLLAFAEALKPTPAKRIARDANRRAKQTVRPSSPAFFPKRHTDAVDEVDVKRSTESKAAREASRRVGVDPCT